jgi:hypothetical protein
LEMRKVSTPNDAHDVPTVNNANNCTNMKTYTHQQIALCVVYLFHFWQRKQLITHSARISNMHSKKCLGTVFVDPTQHTPIT